jgi:hypothetical protein
MADTSLIGGQKVNNEAPRSRKVQVREIHGKNSVP